METFFIWRLPPTNFNDDGSVRRKKLAQTNYSIFACFLFLLSFLRQLVTPPFISQRSLLTTLLDHMDRDDGWMDGSSVLVVRHHMYYHHHKI